jgi:hypothetical protein
MKESDRLSLFKQTGFFEERGAALEHLKDADEILYAEGVDYCLMFGTLIGLFRHNDLIPWDDDMDIIIFDAGRFEDRCRKKFEDKGYVVHEDIRLMKEKNSSVESRKRCGYRIYSEKGSQIPGQSWKFPWLGVWEPEFDDETMILLSEEFTYNTDDFFPLQRRPFLDFSVSFPSNYEKILNDYYGDDWMEICMPSILDHRNYRPTGFPQIKLPVEQVMSFLEGSKL